MIHGAASGKLHYAKGFIFTFESPDTFVPPTREQIEQKKFERKSKASRGRKHSPETRNKISVARTGTKYSLETIEKLRTAQAGVKHSDENKRKMRENHAREGSHPKPVFQYSLPKLELVEQYPSIREAARAVKCSTSLISQVLSKRHPNNLTAKGYHWSDHPLGQEEKQPIREKILQSPRFKNQAPPNE